MSILLIIFSTLFYSCATGEKEAIVVPKDYKGYIVIIYNQKNGTPVKYKGEKRIYEIPENGILKTQFKPNDGLHEFTEYYNGRLDVKESIPSFVDFNELPNNDKVVGLKGANGSANKDYEGKETVEFSLYYVGTKENISQAIKQAEKLDILTLVE